LLSVNKDKTWYNKTRFNKEEIMKTLYRIVGALGILGYLIIIITVLTSKNVDTSIKIVITASSIIGLIGCAVYITVSNLMEKTELQKNKIEFIESYLLTTDDYVNFMKKVEPIAAEIKNNEIQEEAHDDSIDVVPSQEYDQAKLNEGIACLKNGENSKGFAIIFDCSNEGNPRAMAYLGYCYMLGLGSIVNKELALKLFTKSSDAGDSDGKFLLGTAYLNGDIVYKDVVKGKMLIAESAKLGNPKAKEYINNHKM
jgi:hypothetical protein